MLDNRIGSLRYRNFMSFADARPALDDLVVLVGPNGAGKSNFVEGLRFLRDALTIGLDSAITKRGGIDLIRRKLPEGRPPDMEIEAKGLADGYTFSYRVTIGAVGGGEWLIKGEHCRFDGHALERDETSFRMRGPDADPEPHRRIDSKVLMLPLAGRPFRRVANLLRDIGAYSIYPDVLREPRRLLESARLDDDAQNLTSVLRWLRERRSPAADRIRDALGDLVPGVANFRVTNTGGWLAVSLAMRSDDREMWFDASQVSDGTLRLLGILTAIHQRSTPSLIAIEEPELTVHPGAAAMLCDELIEASQNMQVFVTTHSPDIISRMPVSSLRVVEGRADGTRIGKVASDQVAAINDQLFSPSDLIRIEGLRRETSPAG